MLLGRQLRKLGISEDSPPDAEQWRALVACVRRAYAEAEQDRYTLERSLMTSSREMQDLYDGIRASEERHRLLFERSPLPITLFDAASLRILAANDAALKLYG